MGNERHAATERTKKSEKLNVWWLRSGGRSREVFVFFVFFTFLHSSSLLACLTRRWSVRDKGKGDIFFIRSGERSGRAVLKEDPGNKLYSQILFKAKYS